MVEKEVSNSRVDFYRELIVKIISKRREPVAVSRKICGW